MPLAASSLASSLHHSFTLRSFALRKVVARAHAPRLAVARAMAFSADDSTPIVVADDFPSDARLTYFGLPALAEPVRALFVLSGKPWTDHRIKFPEWKETVKPKTKWGQIPVMTIPGDENEMTQSKAMHRLLACKLSVGGAGATPLYPAGTMQAYRIDEMIDTFEDARMKIVPTFAIAGQAEKEAARAALFVEGGAVHELLLKVEKHCGEFGRIVPTTDGSFTAADAWAHFFVCMHRSGSFDGIPADVVDAKTFPKLNAVVDAWGAIPALKKYYEGMVETGDARYKAFAGQ